MRPGGVAAELMAGGGGGERLSLWWTPTPYLVLGFGFILGIIAVALIVLICTWRRGADAVGLGDQQAASSSSSVPALAPLDREPPEVVVIMDGYDLPSFLATAKPLAPATRTGDEAAAPEAGAAAV